MNDRIRTVMDGREHARLEAQLAELQQPCVWTYDDTHDKWDTACGEAFQTICDSPTENGMKFCPFCQKPILGSYPLSESEPEE